MKISIVTVVYNNPQVHEALDSILNQKFEGDLESIVVDGGSRAETLDALKPYLPRLGHFVSERDKGIYDAMNKGIALATGDIVGTLNSDDLYADDQVLQKVLEAFRDPSIDIVYGDLEYVSASDTSRVIRYWRSKPYRPGLFEKGWMPPHPTFFVRRQVFERCGSFNLDYRIAADFELMLRFMARHNTPSVHLPEVLVKFRMGGASNQSLRNILKANLESHRACMENGLKIAPWFIIQKIGSRIPQFFRRKGSS